MNNINKLREQISETGKRLYEKGFSPGWSGNISVKIEDNILITPSGLNLADVKPEDIVLIDMRGNSLENNKKASSEKFMHIEIYRKRQDISTIIHCHAPRSSAFAVAGIPLDSPILAENVFHLGAIPIAEYALPSTKELSDSVAKLFLDHDSVLMANHGVVTGAKDLTEAYYKIETIEYYAEVLLWSKLLGRSKELAPAEIAKILELKAKI